MGRADLRSLRQEAPRGMRPEHVHPYAGRLNPRRFDRMQEDEPPSVETPQPTTGGLLSRTRC